LRELCVTPIWGPAYIKGNGAAMKGYTEQRSVHSQVIYDALLDQFLQRILTHDFAAVNEPNKKQPENASIIELPRHDAKSVDTSSSRKSRAKVMQTVQKRRAG
jgi:hypothetical protein